MWRAGLGVLVAAGIGLGQLRPAQVVILLGPPGSGKSVQAGLLSKTYKVPAISMASLFERESKKRTPLAKALASAIASGELVSDDAANEVMQTRLLRPDAGKGFILDGYPRTPEQAKALDAFLVEHDFPKPTVVILEATDDVLRERLKKRHAADDDAANVERRIREYRDHETFTEGRYGTENTVRVDGSGSVTVVARAIATGIDGLRQKKGLKVRQLEDRPPQ